MKHATLLARRTLASPFILTGATTTTATRPASTFASAAPALLARPVRPTIAAVSTTTCTRARSTLSTPWLPRPAPRPPTNPPPAARARSTLATPWLPRPPRPTVPTPVAARARSTLATPWLPRPTRPSIDAPTAPAAARFRSTLASPWVLRPARPALSSATTSARFASTLAADQTKMTKIAVTGTGQVNPGHEEELKAQLTKAAEESRKEEGNVCYIPTISKKDATKFSVFEVYKDIDALKVHGASSYFQELKKWIDSAGTFSYDVHDLVADTA